MSDLPSLLLAGAVAAPLAGCGFVLLAGRSHGGRLAATVAAAVVSFLCCLGLLAAPPAGGAAELPLGELLPGIPLGLRADPLGLLFAALASFLWIPTAAYSASYMDGLREHSRLRYDACFALVVGAAVGVALAADLATLFLFYEVLTVATWPLVVHKETPEAFAAGRKYLLYTLSGGVALLAGLSLLAAQGGAGALRFEGGGSPGVASLPAEWARIAFWLLFAGFSVKAAVMPVHGWLPTAMIAPTPVSGLLHAVAVVKAGVFGILRLLHSLYGPDLSGALGVQEVLLPLAAFTILAGSMLALLQDDFKARLAYSTVSQLAYLVLGAALLVPDGATGAFFGMAAHGCAKLTMFFVAGAVAVETGITRISGLGGLGRRMPWTFALFGVAALSMASLPPAGGFTEKWFLGLGAWDAGRGWILAVLVASSILNLAYFVPILVSAFFGRPGEDAAGAAEPAGGEARPGLLLPAAVTAAGALLLGLWTGLPAGPFETARLAVCECFEQAILDLPDFDAGRAIPPFLLLLAGGPLVLLLPGLGRRAGLAVLGAAVLVLVLLLPEGDSWRIPWADRELILLHVDPLSRLTGIVFALITFLALLYAAAFAAPRMHLFALLYAGASLGAAFAGDWITLLVFWEVMAVASALLVAEHGAEAAAASFRYLLWHGAGGALLAAGVGLAVLETGSTAIGPVPGGWATLLVLLGIGVNAAFIPLHAWLPDAYARPHVAASVFLSVYTTKAAIYLLARVVPPEGMEPVAWMGGLMALWGVSFAVLQTDMRRLLSYHIVSQVGYMVAGVGLAGALGTDGGMAHVFNHILYKALLFMAVGAVMWRTGERTLERLGGLQARMPITAICFWVAAFSISGVPLFNGFVSKGMVTTAAHHHGTALWLALELASFGTFLSFLKLGWFAFLRPGGGPAAAASDPPAPMTAAMIGAAGLCLLLGLRPSILFDLLPSGGAGHDPWTAGRLVESCAVLGAAAAFFFTAGRRW
ncbi:MAG: hypothetical protein L6R43_09095, partial [Planctomycetes bacterium]|nr:hypothetical protein [Planctomycetota bacterium]